MKIKQYLYSNIASTFFPIIFGLFFITSIIFLVKIASLTSIITLNVWELMTLYLYVVPKIFFYTIPISFFISLVMSMARLSNEYELIVITSFGFNPTRIIKMLFPICFLLSFALLVVSVGLIPKAEHLSSVLLNQKKKEANFNIKASEFGQKFGDWLIYIDEKKDNKFKEVRLFKTQNNTDQFIVSKNAVLQNDKGTLSFILNEGRSFYIEEQTINQIDFEVMNISDSLGKNKNDIFINSYFYWKNNIKNNKDVDKLSFYILVSFFPLMSLYLVIAFGYFNPRYDKNKSLAYSVSFVVLFYVFAQNASDKLFLLSLFVVPSFWIIMSYFIYVKKIKALY